MIVKKAYASAGVDVDLGNPMGDPIGTFLVTYDDTTLVLSDFQPVEAALPQAIAPSDPEAHPRRLLK